MANTITSQTIVDGSRITVIKVTILSDGSGEMDKVVIFDSSAYANDTQNNSLIRIQGSLNGFSGTLYWDATTDVQLISLPSNYYFDEKYLQYGGIPNNGGTGRTGDILMSTSGLATVPAGATGELILRIKKK